MKFTDPAVRPPAERLVELGELLALGVQRLLAAKRKPNRPAKISREELDVAANSEASCGSSMESPA